MVIIARHAALLIKTVGELRERQAAGETKDTALQGFHPMPAGLTVCGLSAEGKKYLLLVSLTESELILNDGFTQTKITIFSLTSSNRFHFVMLTAMKKKIIIEVID